MSTNIVIVMWHIMLIMVYFKQKTNVSNLLPFMSFILLFSSVRLSFLQCVSEISHYHCKKGMNLSYLYCYCFFILIMKCLMFLWIDAAQFLAKMAETLVRATMRNHVPPMCVSIHQRNCSILSSAPSIYVPHTIQTTTTTFFIIYIFSAILQSILKY